MGVPALLFSCAGEAPLTYVSVMGDILACPPPDPTVAAGGQLCQLLDGTIAVVNPGGVALYSSGRVLLHTYTNAGFPTTYSSVATNYIDKIYTIEKVSSTYRILEFDLSLTLTRHWAVAPVSGRAGIFTLAVLSDSSIAYYQTLNSSANTFEVYYHNLNTDTTLGLFGSLALPGVGHNGASCQMASMRDGTVIVGVSDWGPIGLTTTPAGTLYRLNAPGTSYSIGTWAPNSVAPGLLSTSFWVGSYFLDGHSGSDVTKWKIQEIQLSDGAVLNTFTITDPTLNTTTFSTTFTPTSFTDDIIVPTTPTTAPSWRLHRFDMKQRAEDSA